MRILIIGGNGMRVGDGDAFWTLGAALAERGNQVRLRECVESGTPENKCTQDDVRWAGACIVYSYGCATLWGLQEAAGNQGKPASYLILCIIAGVNDVLQGQGPMVWHPPAHVKRAICFQPTKAVPVSQPLRDCDFWISFGEGVMNGWPDAPRLNVNCDELMEGMGPVSQHVLIKDDPTLQDEVTLWMGQAEASLPSQIHGQDAHATTQESA